MSHRTRRIKVVAAVATALLAHAGLALAQGEATRILTASTKDAAKNVDDLSQSVARNASDAVAWRDLGIAQCRLGRHAEASEAFDRASRGLSDDFYLAIYRAVNAEMLGDYPGAAEAYLQAAELDGKTGKHLVQRAAHLRARGLVAPADPDGGFADGPHTLALLPPVDLGGDAADLVPVIADVLTLGLSQADVDVLRPADTERWLAADGRAVSDFDDPTSRDRVARNLARKGIEAVLAGTFLHLPTGELHFRFALIGISEAGAAETQAIPAEVGKKAEELMPLRASIPALWKAMGVTGPSPQLPASLDAARQYSAGLQQLRDGQAAAAADAFCEAKRLAPGVATLEHLCEQMAQLKGADDDPLASSFDDPVRRVDDVVKDLAQRQMRSDRRFQDIR